jgi:ribosomal-protein-serine acetyltransferase
MLKLGAPRRLDTAIPDLQLVPLAEGDAEELFALTTANRAHLRRWLPWVDEVRSVADSSVHVRNGLELRRLGLRLDYTVRLRGRMIGSIAYHLLQQAHRFGVIGYWLALDATGHGYMTAAVRRLVEHGFVDLALNRIELRVAVGNYASQKICTRLGFREEGVLREAEWLHNHFVDLRVNALLRSEWERLKETHTGGGDGA